MQSVDAREIEALSRLYLAPVMETPSAIESNDTSEKYLYAEV